MTISFPQKVSVGCTTNLSASIEAPTSIQPFKAICTENDFLPVSVGDIVFLSDDPAKYTTVVSVDGEFEMTLADDIIKTTDDYFGVLTASTAFKIIQDGTFLNFLQLFSAGSGVDTDETENSSFTVSGCLVTSVDSSGQLSTSLPMGGYEGVYVTTNKKVFFNVEALDVFYANSNAEEIALTGYTFTENNYAGVYSDTLPSSLEDIAEAVSNAVGGGYRNNAPINTRTFGATATFEV